MKVAIYTRKSVYVENSESIETQISLCKKYFNGENEFEIFEDEGYSGKNTNRPAFKRLLLECKMNKFDALICYRLDRISRNVADFSSTLELLQKYNVHFISIKEQFDTSTPMGRAMIYIASVFAQLERETIAERVKDNMLELAKKGCYTGGTVPKGCEIVKKDGKSYLNIVDKELIKMYFDSYLNNGSLFLGYKYLKENRISISREGYRKVLRNPLYVKSSIEVNNYLETRQFRIIGEVNNNNGYMTYGKINNSSIAVVGKHNGVIEPSLWLKVQLQLDERKEMFKHDSETNFLSGVLRCHCCKGFYQLAQVNKVKYYVCQNRVNRTTYGIDKDKHKCENKKYIRAEKIESKISSLIDELKHKEFFNVFFNFKFDNNDDVIKKLEKELIKNEKIINNLVEKTMFLSNEASKPFLNKIEEITKLNLETKSRLETEKLLKLQQETKEDARYYIYDLVKKFDSLDLKEKNNALKVIFGTLEYDSFDESIKL